MVRGYKRKIGEELSKNEGKVRRGSRRPSPGWEAEGLSLASVLLCLHFTVTSGTFPNFLIVLSSFVKEKMLCTFQGFVTMEGASIYPGVRLLEVRDLSFCPFLCLRF